MRRDLAREWARRFVRRTPGTLLCRTARRPGPPWRARRARRVLPPCAAAELRHPAILVAAAVLGTLRCPPPSAAARSFRWAGRLRAPAVASRRSRASKARAPRASRAARPSPAEAPDRGERKLARRHARRGLCGRRRVEHREHAGAEVVVVHRSEERRVGKECR